MPRKKLSEFKSKSLVNDAIGSSYVGWSVKDSSEIGLVSEYDSYVVKVDQAIKGRFKKGLVLLDVKQDGLDSAIEELTNKGYSSVLIEPFFKHSNDAERYLFISRDREGYYFAYSAKGGVNVEDNPETIKKFKISDDFDWANLAKITGISEQNLQSLLKLFKESYFVSLEINPFVIEDSKVKPLDVAIEVDDAGLYFTNNWNYDDTRKAKSQIRETEEQVRILNDNSPASFSLSVLNPDGSIFLLLSGGGASIVIADEVHNLGLGSELANYGEYSGNPNSEETYLYTKQIIKLILDSKSKQKVMFVGGAVANFTDIAKTFSGIIRALDESAELLKAQNFKVYVRRGGPNQEIGLLKIEEALKKYGIFGGVYDPSTSITKALGYALEGLNK
jgi:ATP-citrate lyase beta-subunit